MYKYARKPENSTHKCTNAVNSVQPIRNSSHMAKYFQYITDYENGNGGKRRVSRLTQFIHATLHSTGRNPGTSWKILPGRLRFQILRFQMILECHRALTGMPRFVVAMEEGCYGL